MKAIWASVFVLLVLCGCSQSLDKKIVGSWSVDSAKTKITPPPGSSEEEIKMGMSMLSSFKLDLKEDKTFNLSLPFETKGTWALEGNKLTLKWENKEGDSFKFMNKDSMEFDVEPSGTVMNLTVDDKVKGTLVWTKAEAAK